LAGPYKCVNVVVTVHAVTVGVLESLTIEFEREGGLEHVYGTETGKHAIGGKRATFSARRWFWTDTDDDLFVDLFENKTAFSLTAQISGDAASQILLSDCLAYRLRPVFGAPNDKVGEEISGEAAEWTLP